jgi:hypothetical protein
MIGGHTRSYATGNTCRDIKKALIRGTLSLSGWADIDEGYRMGDGDAVGDVVSVE